jgi:pantoate--beta-alanine ligase
MKSIKIVRTVEALRAHLAPRRGGERIGLVPTMGALHEGHLSLVRETQTRCGCVVVSIFVNPTQFAPHEDFDRYPRNLEADAAKLHSLDAVDLIFAPEVKELYPQGDATRIEVGGPSKGLETDFRPHFFAGVATVVAKLLISALPDFAAFGEKDYQQLLVVRRLAADLRLPTEILGVPIMREPDGLAMSSRNAYLKADERKVAGELNRVLKEVIAQVRAGKSSIADAEAFGKKALLARGFQSVDYVAIRDAATLAPVEKLSSPARVLAAARVGGTRLIDNMAV